jgi:hypothetical protein
MRVLLFIPAFLFTINTFAQKHTPLPHGMVYGSKPDTTDMLIPAKLESFMGNKIRVSTTLRGRVIKVTKAKGGWFELDAGNGKVITAHFKNYNITIPAGLKGRQIIAEGVAVKQLHGDNIPGVANAPTKKSPGDTKTKQRISFEVKGLMVD